MTEQKYKIAFRGRIAEGQTVEQVKANLQRVCKLSPAAAERIFSGKSFVLKSDLDEATASRYCAALEKAGAICAVEPMTGNAPPAPAESPPPPVPAAPPPVSPGKARTQKKEHLAWLHRELPHLVAEGVVDEEAAERIGSFYGPPPKASRKAPLALVICAVLGALLVGLGIILIFAHNWAELGRPVRTLLCFAPLVLGQLLAGLAISRRPDSTAWQEGAATFLMVAVGASIALVGQTYHISGDLPRFLLVWMLLGLPLVYLMRAAMPAALYWVGITAWMGTARFAHEPVALYWLLVLLPAPFLWRLWRKGVRTTARSWLSWTLALCLPLAVGFSLHRFEHRLTFATFALLFSLYYLADRTWQGRDRSTRRRPLLLLGCLGITVVGLALSFGKLWGAHVMRLPLEEFHHLLGFNVLTGLLAANLALLGIMVLRQKSAGGLPFGLAGLFILAFQLFAGYLPGKSSVLVFNLFLLFLGASTLFSGIRAGLTSRVNGGLGIISLLIVARFFDTDLPFTAKGIAFIAIGVGFLLTNILIKRREVTQ
ncbi:MAG: hypothetical protein C0617_03525 [Desulfuromonas sp.]|uniref:DUF2157 domain-containing protein n=1 Tax=Desulfuromonas sp. TaxID=892 RepID=UPI000CBD8C0B|nr:DUF2157 domain-containing protein [Desulfuromonas sp.]PLX85579.1 MAG: hypothetical protein C0617_03525 [Desulfuromonas sp.]